MWRWEDEKISRCEDVKMWGSEDVQMWGCEDVKMRRCEDVRMWRWEDVKMNRCEDEKMWRWEDVKMTRCEDEKMWRWQDVKMRRCEDEKMWRFQDVMGRCEDVVKMFDRPPLLEEPFAQTLSGKTFSHTLIKDMPTPTDGFCSWHVLSSCISNSHLPYEMSSCIYSLHSYVHPYISCSSLSLCHRSFLPVFLCIGTHITGRISNFLLAHHFLQFWVSHNFMFHPEGTMILLLRFFVHNCFSHASAGGGVAGKIGTYLTRAHTRSIKTRTFYLLHAANLFWPKHIHHANPVTRARCILYLYSIDDLVYPSH